MSVTVDITRFNAKIGELQGFGLNTGRILKVEARKMLKSVLSQTHPKDKKVGEFAVLRDISTIFYGVDDATASNAKPMQGNNSGLVKLWTTPDSGRPKVIAVHSNNFRPNASMETMAAIHKTFRTRGIVSKGRGRAAVRLIKAKLNLIDRVVVRESIFESYRREMYSHVGKLRSGFAHAYVKMGGSVPPFVRRHLKSQVTGFVRDALGPGPKPSITIGNTAAGAEPRLGDIVKRAMEGRIKAISTNIRRMIKHGAGKSGDYGYANQ